MLFFCKGMSVWLSRYPLNVAGSHSVSAIVCYCAKHREKEEFPLMSPDRNNWDYKMDNFKTACHMACCLWLAGFREACCLHRACFFCKRSRKIFVKTGQCFLLNGCIFLGSIFFLQKVIVPTLQWLLMSNYKEEQQAIRLGETFTPQKIFVGICYVFWLYPLKLISFIINFIWYNEIAEQAYEVLERNQNMESLQKQQQPTQRRRAGQGSGELESILLNIGEQIWSFSMLIMFLIEASLFVLVATVSNPGAVVASYTGGKDSSHAPIVKVPVFYLANMSMLLLVRTFRGLTRFISSRS